MDIDLSGVYVYTDNSLVDCQLQKNRQTFVDDDSADCNSLSSDDCCHFGQGGPQRRSVDNFVLKCSEP